LFSAYHRRPTYRTARHLRRSYNPRRAVVITEGKPTERCVRIQRAPRTRHLHPLLPPFVNRSRTNKAARSIESGPGKAPGQKKFRCKNVVANSEFRRPRLAPGALSSPWQNSHHGNPPPQTPSAIVVSPSMHLCHPPPFLFRRVVAVIVRGSRNRSVGMTTFHFAVVATAKVDWMALAVVVVAWWRLFRFARDSLAQAISGGELASSIDVTDWQKERLVEYCYMS